MQRQLEEVEWLDAIYKIGTASATKAGARRGLHSLYKSLLVFVAIGFIISRRCQRGILVGLRRRLVGLLGVRGRALVFYILRG